MKTKRLEEICSRHNCRTLVLCGLSFLILSPVTGCQSRFKGESLSYGPVAGLGGGSSDAVSIFYRTQVELSKALELALIESSCGQHQLFNDYNVARERAEVVSTFLAELSSQPADCTGAKTNSFTLISLSDGLTAQQVNTLGHPVLTFSADKSAVESGLAILIPDFEALKGYDTLFNRVAIAESKMSFNDKALKIFWRGSPTGKRSSETNQRLKIVRLSKDLDFLDAAFTSHAQLDTWEDGEQIKSAHPIVPQVSPEDSISNRYLLDIEGNTWGYSRRAWALSSNSVLIRCESDWLQWYSEQEFEAETAGKPVSISSSCDKDSLTAILQLSADEAQDIAQRATGFAKSVFSKAALKDAFQNGLAQAQKLNTVALESDRPVILSLTTSPRRLAKIEQVFDSLHLDHVTEIHLNLPDQYGRDGSLYDEKTLASLQSRYPKLKVFRIGKDLGPITKILPTLERLKGQKVFVLSIDDDQGYRETAIQGITRRLMQNPTGVVGGSGQNLAFWGINGSMNAQIPKSKFGDCHMGELSHCDVVEGFAIIGYPSDLNYDTALMKKLALENRSCFVSDDLVLSFVLNLKGIPTLVVADELWQQPMVQSLPYGFEDDALHRGGGLEIQTTLDINADKYKMCFEFLQAQKVQ